MKTTSKLLSQNDFSAGSKNALQEIGRDSKGVLQATGKGLGKGFGWGINKTKSGIS